jgi:hypothetical protein
MMRAGECDIETLTAVGCHIHGDLGELLPDEEAFDSDDTRGSSVSPADILTVAIDALVAAAQAVR